MSQKRVAGTELNHDNWNEEEDNEEAGEFQKAANDVLEKRIRKIAKRRIPNKSDDKEVFNPFSGFGGFQNQHTAAAKSPFSFLSKISNDTAATKTNSSEHKTSENDTNMEYFSKVKSLNRAFVEWIKSKIEENDLCDLSPVFRDYEKYMKQFEELKTKKASNFSFEKPKASPVGIFSTPISSNFLSGASKPEPAPKSPPTAVLQESDKKQGFSFGSALQTSPQLSANKPLPTATPFSFGLPTSSGFGGFGVTSTPFSFSNVAQTPASNTGNTNDGGGGEEEAEEEPPKNEFVPVVEEDSLYSKRCKVFVKTASEYVDRGVGTLYMKKVDEKIQLLVRADTNLGNIIFNIIVTEGLPVSRQGKNNVMIVCVPTPDSKPTPTPVLIRVKTSEEADELKEKIEKCMKN